MLDLNHRQGLWLLATIAITGCSEGIGPGGRGRLAFLRYNGTTGSDYQIYTVAFSTGDTAALTHLAANRWIPSWSPDGSKIAFNSDQDSTGQEIFVMNADGSLLHRLTNFLGQALCPSWSADGKKILFDFEGGRNPALYVMNADGSDTTRLAQGTHPFYQCPVWSPDGSRIAFVSADSADVLYTDIYLLNADGTGEINWSHNPGRFDTQPAWSPDGTKIAFFSERNGLAGLFVMNVDGTGLKPLVTAPGNNTCPAWSPDGQWIAFTSTRDGQTELYAMALDGSSTRRLTDDSEEDICPRWQP